MSHFEKTLSSQTVYHGKIIDLNVDQVQLENGSVATREVVKHNGGVTILAVDGDDILFVRQFRYPQGKVVLELPAGKLEKGEVPQDCARRELEEETGFLPGSLEPFGQIFPTPAYVDEIIHLYLARDLTSARQHLDADEFLTVERIPFSRALELCLNGEIQDAKTLIAVCKYALLQKKP